MKKTIAYCSLGMAILGLSHAQIRSGFDSFSLAANDDLSTDLVPIGFELDFFGGLRDQLYVNNNGNVTFDNALFEFSPSDVPIGSTEIFAPFFSDVDTTGPGSELVTYGQGTVGGQRAFGVNWVDVGYFSGRTDLINSFQLVLIERSDIVAGGFDVEFNYRQIQFETGDASGGFNGLGGDSARVFYSDGDSDDLSVLPGSGVNGALLDGGSDALIELTNVDLPGRFVIFVRDGEATEFDPNPTDDDGDDGDGGDGGEPVVPVPEPIIVIEITDPSVNTIRDTVRAFSVQMSADINKRLVRFRNGNSSENNISLGSPSWSVISESNPWMNNVSFYADLNTFDYDIDARSVPNAGGLITSRLPSTEVSGERGVVGFEYSKNKNFSLGVAAVYSSGDANHSDGSFNADYDGFGAYGYATYQTDEINDMGLRLFADAQIGVQHIDLDTVHNDSFNGRRANGSSDSTGVSYELNLGSYFEAGGLQHSGFVQFRSNEGDVDPFRATGVGTFSNIPGIEFDSQTLTVGYQVSKPLQYLNTKITPFASFAYEEELTSQDSSIGGNRAVDAPDGGKIVAAGLQFEPQAGFQITVDGEYRTYDGGDATRVGISLGLQF